METITKPLIKGGVAVSQYITDATLVDTEFGGTTSFESLSADKAWIGELTADHAIIGGVVVENDNVPVSINQFMNATTITPSGVYSKNGIFTNMESISYQSIDMTTNSLEVGDAGEGQLLLNGTMTVNGSTSISNKSDVIETKITGDLIQAENAKFNNLDISGLDLDNFHAINGAIDNLVSKDVSITSSVNCQGVITTDNLVCVTKSSIGESHFFNLTPLYPDSLVRTVNFNATEGTIYNLLIQHSFNTTGNANFKQRVGIEGSASISNLTTLGVTQLKHGLEAGNVSTFDIVRAQTFSVSGNATLSGKLSANSEASINNLTTRGVLQCKDGVQSDGTSSFNDIIANTATISNVMINGDLIVNGNIRCVSSTVLGTITSNVSQINNHLVSHGTSELHNRLQRLPTYGGFSEYGEPMCPVVERFFDNADASYAALTDFRYVTSEQSFLIDYNFQGITFTSSPSGKIFVEVGWALIYRSNNLVFMWKTLNSGTTTGYIPFVYTESVPFPCVNENDREYYVSFLIRAPKTSGQGPRFTSAKFDRSPFSGKYCRKPGFIFTPYSGTL